MGVHPMERVTLDLSNKDHWTSGPLLEIHVSLSDSVAHPIWFATMLDFVKALRIDGPYCDINDINKVERVIQYGADVCDESYGTWDLGDDQRIGVILLRSNYAACDLILGVPPRQVNVLFPPFPWARVPWCPSAKNCELIMRFVKRLREAHAQLGLRAALIQDEVKFCRLTRASRGILVDRAFVELFGVEEQMTSPLVVVPFDDGCPARGILPSEYVEGKG